MKKKKRKLTLKNLLREGILEILNEIESDKYIKLSQSDLQSLKNVKRIFGPSPSVSDLRVIPSISEFGEVRVPKLKGFLLRYVNPDIAEPAEEMLAAFIMTITNFTVVFAKDDLDAIVPYGDVTNIAIERGRKLNPVDSMKKSIENVSKILGLTTEEYMESLMGMSELAGGITNVNMADMLRMMTRAGEMQRIRERLMSLLNRDLPNLLEMCQLLYSTFYRPKRIDYFVVDAIKNSQLKMMAESFNFLYSTFVFLSEYKNLPHDAKYVSALNESEDLIFDIGTAINVISLYCANASLGRDPETGIGNIERRPPDDEGGGGVPEPV